MQLRSRSFSQVLLALSIFVLVWVPSAPLIADDDDQIEPEYLFYPLPPDLPRLQFLKSYSTSLDVTAGEGGLKSFLFGAEDTGGHLVTRSYGVAVHEANRNGHGVYDVQYRNRDNSRDVEPDGHIHVAFTPFDNGSEYINGEENPNYGDEHIDGPLQFRVFFRRGFSRRETDGGANDDELPTPEVEFRNQIVKHAGFTEPLQ